MPLLTLMPSGKTAEVPTGTALLTAILASGEKLACTCGGQGGCEASHVFVPEGRKSLSKAERTEHATLDGLIGVSSKSRLACQAKMGEENVTIEILSFM
jgi:2Fe-2S ferredoxin